jgi:hypothetical protein
MKFQKIVLAMLALILCVNSIGIFFLVSESKKQTEIARSELEVATLQAKLESDWLLGYTENLYTQGWNIPAACEDIAAISERIYGIRSGYFFVDLW